jgi:hypothetical protein
MKDKKNKKPKDEFIKKGMFMTYADFLKLKKRRQAK